MWCASNPIYPVCHHLLTLAIYSRDYLAVFDVHEAPIHPGNFFSAYHQSAVSRSAVYVICVGVFMLTESVAWLMSSLVSKQKPLASRVSWQSWAISFYPLGCLRTKPLRSELLHTSFFWKERRSVAHVTSCEFMLHCVYFLYEADKIDWKPCHPRW